MVKFFLGTIGLCGLVLSFFSFVSAEIIPPANDSLGSSYEESPRALSQQLVAQVLGRKIWAVDLKPEGDFLTDEQSEMTEEEKADWLRTYRKERIKELVLRPLLDQYARDHRIAVSDSEIQPLVSLLTNDENIQEQRIAEEEFLEEIKARKMQLEETLDLPHLTEEARNEAFEELIRLEKAIPQLEKENLQEELTTMASEMVKVWKINSALYKTYGGRVVLGETGSEPRDAYRDFLKEKAKEGAFHFYDEGLAKVFWEYFLNDRGHTFYTSEEGAQLMQSPWWLEGKEGRSRGI